MTLSYNSIISGGSSGSLSNDFTINVGSSGYTAVPLGTSFPAGSYICTSSLSDATLDIYFIHEDGTSAGYANATTATTTITASKSFNKVVIYGAANNDTLTFEFKYVFAPNAASSTDFTAVGPKITSVSDADLQNINDTTVISGFNFAEDVEVSFTGSGYSSTPAKSIVRTSSTSLTVTRPDNFPTSSSPYTITVTNPGVPNPTSTSSHILSNSITAGNSPIWVTASTLTHFVKTVSYSQTIEATDSDGGSSVTYSIVSGSLPDGITFNTSTATFSGTPTANSGTPYSYTIRATDSGGNYVDRTFSLSQVVADAPTSVSGTDVGTNRAFNNGAVSVSFSAPSYTGTSSITSYTVTASTGQTASGASSPIVVTGIATGAAPTFTVTAANSSGTSLSSNASDSVSVTTVPQAPTIGTATRNSNTNVSLTFTAPLSNGGKNITSYVTTTSPSISTTTTGTSSPLSVTASFANGQVYSFQVAAVNQNGTSEYSSSSNSIQVAFVVITGGTLSSDATYYYRAFTSTGTIESTSSIAAEALIVAGGGGGSGRSTSRYGSNIYGGGGGGGGMRSISFTLPAGSTAITIGSGGSGVGAGVQGSNGSDSSVGAFGSCTGGGGGGNGSGPSAGSNGGSGGGSGGWSQYKVGSNSASGGTGVSGQGNAGGSGYGGGGGGKGSAGSGGTAGSAGTIWSFTGAAGGAGSAGTTTPGTSNSGTGGNGSGPNGAAGGSGGSGYVVVRYLRSAVGG